MYNFTIKQLEILKAVVETGSFTKAAENMYLSQSTVSGHIAELEKVLDQKLFDRTFKKQPTPTPSGLEIYHLGCKVLSMCGEIETRSQQMSMHTLAIGASTVPADHLLPEYMADFLKVCPDCRFHVKKGNSVKIHEMLLNHEIELGLVGSAFDKRRLQYYELETDPLVVITPATARFRDMQERGVLGRELLGEPLICREEGSGTQRAADEYLKKNMPDRTDWCPVVRLDSPEGLVNAVISGIGVAIVSTISIRNRAKSGEFLVFPLDTSVVTRSIYLARNKNESLSAAAQAFVHRVAHQYVLPVSRKNT